MKINVIGGGLGNEKYLSLEAMEVIKNSELVITNHRMKEMILKINKNTKAVDIKDTVSEIKKSNKKIISLVVSGDVGFYSLSKIISKEFDDIEYFNGISSMQYFMGKINKSYDDIIYISLHGRTKNVIPYVCYNKKVFALCGGENNVSFILNKLNSSALGDVNVFIGENLSLKNEKITSGQVKDFVKNNFSNLSVIYFENNDFIQKNKQIFDNDILRDKVPMTKEEVRSIIISKMNLKPDDIVYDIGAGTGAVSLSLATNLYEGMVFAIEKKDIAVNLIKKNIKKFKTFNIEVIEGNAPEALENLPKPTKAFIGGSSGNLKEIIEFCYSLNKDVQFVITSVTLETLTESIEIFKSKNIEPKVTQINISNSTKVGSYNMMLANNNIFMIYS